MRGLFQGGGRPGGTIVSKPRSRAAARGSFRGRRPDQRFLFIQPFQRFRLSLGVVQVPGTRTAHQVGKGRPVVFELRLDGADEALPPRTPPSQSDLDRSREVFETTAFGAIAVTQAMLPVLLRSPAGRIVNLSSTVGSLALASDPALPWSKFGLLGYNSSKCALNAVTVHFANELGETAIKVDAACPRYVATDINGHSGYRTPDEGARIVVKLASLPADGHSGGFFNEEGPLPW